MSEFMVSFKIFAILKPLFIIKTNHNNFSLLANKNNFLILIKNPLN